MEMGRGVGDTGLVFLLSFVVCQMEQGTGLCPFQALAQEQYSWQMFICLMEFFKTRCRNHGLFQTGRAHFFVCRTTYLNIHWVIHRGSS